MFDNCNLVSRSEFQRLCGGVPRSTLRYYEKAGILKPAYVEENGYQFYNISQVYTYFHIHFLKLIDCSVSEISEIFNTPDRDYASLIEKKELVLEESIACLQQIYNTLKRMDHMREKFPIEKCGKIRTFHGDRIVYYKHIYVKEPHDYNMREFLDRRTVDRDMVRSNYNYLMYPMGVSIDKERFLEGTETFDSYVIMMNEWEDGVDNKTSYVGNYVSISYVSSTPLGKKEYLPILREYIIKHSLTLLGDIYTITIPLRSRNRVDAEYLSAIYCRIEEEITIEEE